MSNRKKAQEFLIKSIEEIAPGIGNKELYEDMFKDMSDSAFSLLMKRVEEGSFTFPIFIPNSKSKVVSVERNLKIGKRLGYDFFTRLKISGREGLPDTITPVKHLVLDLPLRRASQMGSKKISVPDDSRVIDHMSGQATGSSKGARISYPELLLLAGMGLDKTLEELVTVKGGDAGAFRAYNAIVAKYGKVNLKTVRNYYTGVTSVSTLRTFLACMHLRSNL